MIRAILPAAGLSRRMGVQKHLLPFGPCTVIERIVDELSRAGVDEIHVVVGHQADRIAAALSGRPVRILSNPDFETTEMLASVRCGLQALPMDCAAILVAPGDQPAITAELVRAMIAAFSSAGKGIVVPTYAMRRGHPLLFSARYCGEILTNYDQQGLRGLLAAYPEDVFELPVSSSAVLADMNCPEDYRRELARLAPRTDPAIIPLERGKQPGSASQERGGG